MGNKSREGLFIGVAMLALASLPLVGLFAWMSVKLGEDFFIPTIICSAVAGTIILRGPVGRALARRIEGGNTEPAPEVLGEVDELRQRMMELEERVDFAERMIARPQEIERAGS